MPPVGFEPTISAGERPQTHALDRAATGTGNSTMYDLKFLFSVGSYIGTNLHVVAFEKTVILTL